MGTQETQFQDAETCLKQADFEFKNRRFDAAVPLYEQALEMLQQTRTSGHTDIAYCMQNLGDACALSGDFKKAYEVLRELLEIRQRQPGTNNVDLISTKYKVAKMLEMAGMEKLAAQQYDEAMRLAEPSLYAGHPLLTIIYVAYLELLRRTGGSAELVEYVAQKATESGSGALGVGASLLDSMHLRDYVALVPPAPGSRAPEAQVQQHEPAAPKKPFPVAMVRNVVIGIVALGAIGAGVYVATQHSAKKEVRQKQAEAVKTYEGQSFESADGQEKLVFVPGGNVDAVLDGVKRKLPVLMLPAGSSFTDGGNIGKYRAFRKVDSGMQSDEGKYLYADGTTENQMVQRLKRISMAAQKYYDEHKEYPKTSQQLAEIDPTVLDDVITKAKDDIAFVDAGEERDWTPGQTPRLIQPL
jgi:tetratricopeptide (TPR) repeat protein